jgi:hypothetical protein
MSNETRCCGHAVGFGSSGKILIFPFKDMSQEEGENEDVRCPVCGRVFFSGEVADGAADFLSEELASWMQNHTNHDVFFSDFNYDSLSWTLFTNGGKKHFEKCLLKSGGKSMSTRSWLDFYSASRNAWGKGTPSSLRRPSRSACTLSGCPMLKQYGRPTLMKLNSP